MNAVRALFLLILAGCSAAGSRLGAPVWSWTKGLQLHYEVMMVNDDEPSDAPFREGYKHDLQLDVVEVSDAGVATIKVTIKRVVIKNGSFTDFDSDRDPPVERNRVAGGMFSLAGLSFHMKMDHQWRVVEVEGYGKMEFDSQDLGWMEGVDWPKALAEADKSARGRIQELFPVLPPTTNPHTTQFTVNRRGIVQPFPAQGVRRLAGDGMTEVVYKTDVARNPDDQVGHTGGTFRAKGVWTASGKLRLWETTLRLRQASFQWFNAEATIEETKMRTRLVGE